MSMHHLPSRPGQTTLVISDAARAEEIVKVAKDIVAKTGRTVAVIDLDGAEISTIFPTRH
jgi:hypothetical protein